MLPIGLCVQTACIWEATARKPGNVTRFVDFADVGYLDFILSAAAIAPVLDGAAHRPVGQTILDAVRATRQVVSTNTNLGIILLLAPLAAVPATDEFRSGLTRVLDRLDVTDSRLVYEAIGLAQPGGMGQVAEQDIRDEPSQSLRAVMQLAAERDSIARQYATDYREVFEIALPALRGGLMQMASLETAIIGCHLRWMAAVPDSLIARKRGRAEAIEASRRAAHVLDADWPRAETGRRLLGELDTWLRADGHGRNPGTTADLVTACLFIALRTGVLTLPLALPWNGGNVYL